MATVTGLTATRMLAIEGASIVSGTVVAGNLILTKQNGTTINAGAVAGAAGAAGPTGVAGPAGTNGTNGSVWRAAPGVPADATGNNGDFYLNTTTGAYYQKVSGVYGTALGNLTGPAGTGGTGGTGSSTLDTAFPVTLGVALSDENTTVTTTPSIKAKLRAPYAFTLSSVRLSANTNSGTGTTTINITNGAGASLFTTKPTLVATTLTSVTGNTASVLNSTNASIVDDDLLTFTLDTVGTATTGLKCWLIGTRSVATAATAPSQITTFTAISPNGLANGTTPGQITLTWTAPATGGAAITGYKVEAKLTSSGTWPTTPLNANFGGTTMTATTIDGTTALVVGTSYDFRVSAINSVGTATPAVVTGIIPKTLTNAPTGLGATAGNAQVSLAWTAPNNNGGSAITTYAVGYRLTSAGGAYTNFSHADSTTANIVVTGLSNSNAYDFSVSAVNAAGTSTAATASATPLAASGSSPTLRGFAYREFANTTTANTTINPTNTTVASGGFTVRPNGGDLLVLAVMSLGGSKTYGTPTGFTGWTAYATSYIGSVGTLEIYTRIAGGSTGSVTTDAAYTVASGGSNWMGYMNCFAFGGATAIDTTAFTMGQTTLTPNAPSVTATVANTTNITGVFAFSPVLTSVTQSYGTTARSIITFGSGSTLSGYGYLTATQAISASGATGTKSHTMTISGGVTPPTSDGYTIGVK